MTVSDIAPWFFLSNLVTAAFAAYVADEKGRSIISWVVLTLVFGLIALIALAGIPVIPEEKRRRVLRPGRIGKDARAWNPLLGPPPPGGEPRD